MLLTRINLGRRLRSIIKAQYKHIKVATKDVGVNDRTLRRAWGRHTRCAFATVLAYYDRLGYEVHFTVQRKGVRNDERHGMAAASTIPDAEC